MNGTRTVVGDHFQDPGEFEELLEAAERQACKSGDIDMVAGVRERWDHYMTRAYLSPRQLEQLWRIAGEG